MNYTVNVFGLLVHIIVLLSYIFDFLTTNFKPGKMSSSVVLWQVADFSLSPEDMAVLDTFERGWRCCNPKITVNGKEVPRDENHPYYPFKEPY